MKHFFLPIASDKRRYVATLLTLGLTLVGFQANAQTKEEVKSKIAGNVCDCLQKKEAEKSFDTMSKVQATAVSQPCFVAGAAKEWTGLRNAYGPSSVGNDALMKQIGREVAGVMMQNCPVFLQVSLAMARDKSNAQVGPTAGTTCQTTGRLGALHGAGIALLDLEVSKTEQAQFAWLQRPTEGDALLPQLAQLKGKLVRVLWQEVDVLDPTTATYHKVRQLTGIEQQ